MPTLRFFIADLGFELLGERNYVYDGNATIESLMVYVRQLPYPVGTDLQPHLTPVQVVKLETPLTVAKIDDIDSKEWSERIRKRHFKIADSQEKISNCDPHQDLVKIVINCSDPTDPIDLPTIVEDKAVHTVPSRTDSHVRELLTKKMRSLVRSPSTDAKPEALRQTQLSTRPDAIFNGRPVGLTGPPITLYSPIFQKFITKLANIPENIKREDLEIANVLLTKSSPYYENELKRQQKIGALIKHFLNCVDVPATFLVDECSFVPDMNRQVPACGLYVGLLAERRLFSLLSEFKNNLGTGNCDPNDQVAKDYLCACINTALAELRRVSCMPVFFLSFVGPYMMVSGGIFLDGVVTQPLTDFISLIPGVLPRHLLIRRIAHTLLTLRECLDDLDHYYRVMSKPSPSNKNLLAPAPHLTSLVTNGVHIKLKYQARTREARDARAVFLASAELPNEVPKLCIVKFTEQYCPEAHHVLEEFGVAPKLMHCKLEVDVGMLCVVTEYVDVDEHARLSSAGAQRLRDGLRALQAQSFVFGDLRDANILLDSTGSPWVVDFDWSGKAGCAKYPFDLNLDIDWAEGVVGGELIQPEHDLAMLDKYITSFTGDGDVQMG